VEDFRANALWKINDSLNLSFFSFYDRSRNGDGFYAFPQLGTLNRATIVAENAEFITRINSVKLDANLGFATWSVVAADSRKQQNSIGDLTPYYGPPTVGTSSATTHGDMVETRLTSPGQQKFEWLVGAYYGRFNEIYPTPTYEDNADIYDFTVGYVSNEIAGFGEATYRFNDQWRATAGGRYYNIRLTTDTVQGVPGTPYDTVIGSQRGTGFSPKASITFEPNKELMIYGLVSKGFRMGGVNLNTQIASFPTPATYGSDSLINYEIGVRTAWLDHTLTWDTTFFYIDWSNIQLRLARPDGRSYVANAGSAHSKGIENTLSWRPTASLSLVGTLTYLDAALAADLALGDGTVLRDGATLPGASKWTSSETATYTFGGSYAPFVGASHRWVSGSESDFSNTLPIGNYHLIDVRAGAYFGPVSAMLYVDNLADRRGVTAAATFGDYLNDFYVRPRTFGIQVDWRLGK
jgi:outer membrane receptor protein involved in Fe transport